ncbi:MAG: class I SAM-dependent methyltransferase, partial [Spirochaetota bacterium]
MSEFTNENRKHWDEVVDVHSESEFYDLQSFKSGKLSLNSIEREEMGDVRGKELLHLQCHFGIDTLSWARLGAKVTGADFSEKAISKARDLSDELGIESEFICSDLYSTVSINIENYPIFNRFKGL